MRKIYKYEVTYEPIKMPTGATILSAGVQQDKIFVWADVELAMDPANQKYEYREIRVIATGEAIDMFHHYKFIGTVQMSNEGFGGPSELVFHIMELL